MTDHLQERARADHGDALQAIEWVLNVNRDGQHDDFLRAWQQGDLWEWPEFYEWLDAQPAFATPRPVETGEGRPVRITRSGPHPVQPGQPLKLMTFAELDAEAAAFASPTPEPVVEALLAIRGEIGPAKAYAESCGLQGGTLPSAVHIKLDMIDGYAKNALAALDATPGEGEEVSAVIPAGMKPWTGGDGPPDDWDGGAVLCESGLTCDPEDKASLIWVHAGLVNGVDDIIAYTPVPAAPLSGSVVR